MSINERTKVKVNCTGQPVNRDRQNEDNPGRVSRFASEFTKTVGENGLITISASNGSFISARQIAADTLYVIDVLVPKELRDTGYGSALYKRLVQEHPEATRIKGVPGMDNAQALLENGGKVAEVPRSKALEKLGFTEHRMEDGFMVSEKPKNNE